MKTRIRRWRFRLAYRLAPELKPQTRIWFNGAGYSSTPTTGPAVNWTWNGPVAP
jgi:hypothetical protein